MKIAYIIYPEVIISNRSNGIRAQAIAWAEILEKYYNISVTFVNNWNDYNWRDFDAIHLFGGGGNWVERVSKRLKPMNDRIVYSPIVDPNPNANIKIDRLKVLLPKLALNKIMTNFSLRERQYRYIRRVLVRSNFEKSYIQRVYAVNENKFKLVPLSFTPSLCNDILNRQQKENFCFHISSLYQDRKNVLRLVKAAKKYGFDLYLAGNKGTDAQFKFLQDEISNSSNIHVLGFISEEQKIAFYKRAKVFALPSLQEGVGIVALDAALLGCEIVITNIGAPKEYYNNMACVVNPYDIDQIGVSIQKLLNDEVKYQTQLSDYIEKFYSPQIIGAKLIGAYNF